MVTITLITELGTGATRAQKLAAASDATAHPVMTSLCAALPEPVRAKVRQVLSEAAREGLTVAQTVRRLRGPGIDRRAAQALARTGLAVISDRTRPY